MKRKLRTGDFVLFAAAGALGVWAYSVFGDARGLRREAGRLAGEAVETEAALAAATKAVTQQRREWEKTKEDDAERGRLQSSEERLERAVLGLVEELRGRTAAGDSAKPKTPTSLKRPAPPSGRAGNVCFPELLGDPEYARLSVTYFRFVLEKSHGELLMTLGLPAEQRGRLLDLLVEKKFAELDAGDLLRDRTAAGSREALAEMRKGGAPVLAEIDAEIRAVIGEGAFERYRSFELTQWVRRPVERLALRLSVVGQPLRLEQQAALRDLLVTEIKPDPKTGRYYATEFPDAAVERARSLLTPQQWEELRRLEEQIKAFSAMVGWQERWEAKQFEAQRSPAAAKSADARKDGK